MNAIAQTRAAELSQAAELLYEARLDVRTIDGLPADIAPRTLAEGYAIADQLAERLQWPVAGWFCGAMNPEIQRLLRLDEPYCARLFAPLVFQSPATLDSKQYPPAIVETEIAFTLNADMPPRSQPYSEAEVVAAIESVHGSIEVVAGHLAEWGEQDPYSVIADNGTDGALIVGEGFYDVAALDLNSVAVVVTLNGEVVRNGVGASVSDGPISAITWLVNAHSVHGGLKRGYVNNTGTLTSILPVSAGDRVEADFGVLGKVHLELA